MDTSSAAPTRIGAARCRESDRTDRPLAGSPRGDPRPVGRL